MQQDPDQLSRKVRYDGVRQKRKKRSRIRKWILSILTIILLAVAGWGTYLYAQYKGSIDDIQKSAKISKTRNVSNLIARGKPFSVLVMGTDVGELNRNDREGLTDSMMLVTINPKTDKVTMMSIPRDIMTAIPGYEDSFPQKLNAAYAYGGVGATMKAVQNYLNVPIDSYALVNMKGLTTLVDKVGGVSVKSPMDFQYSQDTAHDYGPDLYRFHKGSTKWEYSDDNGATWTSSKTKLTGEAALAFSRMRYDDPQGDYGRQQRQRLVLQALIKKSVNAETLLNASFIKSLSKYAQTDLSFNNILKIAQNYRNAAKNQDSDHMQGTGVMYDGGSYQAVTNSEKQRVTNKLRKQLGLSEKETGTQFGGDVPSSGTSIANTYLSQIGETLEQ
ncbi:LCP family protein [Fructobacillus fructosus]|uniref:LCP family protein n=1 Tax=Fructobacillus fructosus TaxID=1631 RepID=UPI002DA01F97|nr:Anionic cell wall polymer biosynthesis enzyme TagV/TagU [Fructobacillus fructosus]CAK1241311.1 Anionic cell wall polymer biosynthesis enzyme TagV/TagU [Fructobacillus fructosus]CAK1242865.1 Anionic cell wall polymer biosynthesis enzyme TagV/TagU [Fructobacillus fructosus]